MSTIDPLIAAVEQAGSAQELLRATAALAGSGAAAAAPTLVEVLGFNNPGAAVAAVDGLIAIGTPAVEHLLQLDPRNYGARAWAVRALAGIGDVRGLELLIDALIDDVGPSVRRAAAKGLGSLQLEALAAGERAAVQRRCLEALLQGCSDGEWVVRYAVIVGLEALVLGSGWSVEHTAHQQSCSALHALSRDATTVVQLRAALAHQRITP